MPKPFRDFSRRGLLASGAVSRSWSVSSFIITICILAMDDKFSTEHLDSFHCEAFALAVKKN